MINIRAAKVASVYTVTSVLIRPRTKSTSNGMYPFVQEIAGDGKMAKKPQKTSCIQLGGYIQRRKALGGLAKVPNAACVRLSLTSLAMASPPVSRVPLRE